MRCLRLLSVIVFSLVMASNSYACPGCQNPNLPVVPSGAVALDGQAIQWGITLSSAPIWVEHEAGCTNLNDCDETPKQPKYIHDQFILPTELRLSVDYALSDAFALGLVAPVRVIHTTIEYRLPNGDAYTPLDDGIHHRDETLFGLSDPLIIIRWGASFADGWWCVLRAGTSIPLGKTEENPFSAGDSGEAHQHIQFGTGTFDPFASIALARAFGDWQLGGYGQITGAVYESSKGFRAGMTSLTAARIAYKLGPRHIVQGMVSWFRQGAEKWDGIVQQDGLLGRQELLLGLGTTFRLGGPQFLMMVQTAIWRDIYVGQESEAGQITAPISVTVGYQGVLNL